MPIPLLCSLGGKIIPCFSSSVLKSSCPKHCPCSPLPPPRVPPTPLGDGAGEVPAQGSSTDAGQEGGLQGACSSSFHSLLPCKGHGPSQASFHLPRALTHSCRQHPPLPGRVCRTASEQCFKGRVSREKHQGVSLGCSPRDPLTRQGPNPRFPAEDLSR